MALSDTIIGPLRAFVNRLRTRLWLRRERRALEVLAESWRHTGTPTARYRELQHAMRPLGVHSEAYRKTVIVRCAPPLLRQFERYEVGRN